MNEAMVEAINEREPAFLTRDGKGKGYVCPQCGSGSGPKGTGLHRDPGAPTHWKCFACGGYFDVLDLYGLAFGLETFPEKLAGAAAYYGLTVSAPRRMAERAECDAEVRAIILSMLTRTHTVSFTARAAAAVCGVKTVCAYVAVKIGGYTVMVDPIRVVSV